MVELLSYDFMQRALLAAVLIGCAAPSVGVFLVQRQLSLIGDGMGHVALTGVALGVLTGGQPVLVALLVTVVAAVVIEVVRARGRTSGDVALAMMFYGGIALGVVLLARVPGGGALLQGYLFGSITTTSPGDLLVLAVLAVLVLALTWTLRPRLFAVANDPEYSRAAGLPVLALNVALSVLTAVTVVVSMRIVGVLLISALMIVPNATSQLLARSFRAAMALAVLIGLGCSLAGVAASYYLATPSGGTIVILAICLFGLVVAGTAIRAQLRARTHRYAEPHAHEHGPDCGHERVPHGDHEDYLHDGHLHAPHGDHYDEHPHPGGGRPAP